MWGVMYICWKFCPLQLQLKAGHSKEACLETHSSRWDGRHWSPRWTTVYCLRFPSLTMFFIWLSSSLNRIPSVLYWTPVLCVILKGWSKVKTGKLEYTVPLGAEDLTFLWVSSDQGLDTTGGNFEGTWELGGICCQTAGQRQGWYSLKQSAWVADMLIPLGN